MVDVMDRAAGCLVGMAYGDALGVPYEYGSRPLPPLGGAGLFGGGLGNYEPGEWSDDTQMAICIAMAATEADLTTDDLDAVAARFEEWYRSGPADIGVQHGWPGMAEPDLSSLARRLAEQAEQRRRP